MRVPRDLTADPPPTRRRRARWWLLGLLVVIIILAVSLRSLAGIYTDSLWFDSVNYHNVFSTLLVIKLGLFGVFGAIFFAVLWINLVVCDRIAGHDVVLAQDDELVRRYQQFVRPYAGRIYVALAFILALIGASGTIGQWNSWILFLHGGNFGVTDPQFHKDIGFYVFKLPFLTFVVDWTLAILIVTLAVVVVFHYLNGGIQPQRGLPRVRPPVKAHVSVLLALIALTKAVGYVLQRWSLVNAQDGYVNGAGYTDVHARLPAETLLIWVSVFAAGILLFNIRRQGWTLPVLAIGIWAFVALVVGIIYPALLQALKVTPAQSSLEAPYIQRNITATRDAYGLNNVAVHSFPASTSITASQVLSAAPTITNVRQWDPDPTISLQAFQREQGIFSYYTFPSIGVDRYTINDQLTPVLIGARQIGGNLPSQSWVNTHLQYTHGNGAVIALANQTQSNNPVYGIQGVPPSSSPGLPQIKQAGIYFGLGETGYVVANSKQLEVDYQTSDNSSVESHYSGSGGVQLSSLFKRAAFALRLGDLNLLISSQITDKSRIMFVRDPVAMAEKAAPFLSFDSNPYAVVNDGHIDWVVDGYTTTANYPYSQNADSQQVAIGSSLPVELQLRAELGEGDHRRLLGQDDLLRRGPQGPDHPGLRGRLPEHVHTAVEDAGIAAGPPALPPEHLLHSVCDLRPLPPDHSLRLLRGEQRVAALAHGGRRSQVAGVARAEHLQLAGPAGLDGPGPHGTAVPGVLVAQHEPTGVHGVRRLRAGVAGVALDQQQPELQPDGVDGGAVRSGALRRLRRVRDAARHPGSGQRRRGDLGQLDGVEGHFAAGPRRFLGPVGRDADGAHCGFDGLPAPALCGLVEHAAAEPAVRDRGAGQERRDRYVAVQRADGRVRHLGAVDRRVVPAAGVDAGRHHRARAVSGYLAAAQTQYQNALNALKAGNLAGYQSDIDAMAQQITLAQQALGKAPGTATGSGSTTTTTAPSSKVKGSKATTTSTTAATSSTPTGGGSGNSGNSGTSPDTSTTTTSAAGSTATTTPLVSAVRTGRGGGGG